MDFVEVGRVIGAYGIRGWIKVKPYAERPLSGNTLFAVRKWRLVASHSSESDAEERWITVLNTKPQHDFLLAQCAECHTREAAQAFKGWRVSIRRADFPALPQDEYYWVDLIGLQVINAEGITLGAVHHLLDNGAQAVLCIEPSAPNPAGCAKHAEWRIPFVASYILKVDLARRQLVVDWRQDWSQ